jgi:uncharacterized protein YcbK (DUF882 family)
MKKLFDGTRRGFLQLGMSGLVCAVATPAIAVPRMRDMREIAFHNLHTDEKLRITYWKQGRYSRNAMDKINHILRDHYSGEVFPMSPRLIDMLYDLQARLHQDGPIEVISAYRSPQTNMMLASYSDGVAKHSYHTRGMAIDIRMQNAPLPKLYKTALNMRRGGVGYYPDSEFVHVDVGPLRRW